MIGPMAEAAKQSYRILIRRAKDGLFLTTADGWSSDSGSAREFPHSADAAIFAEGRLSGVDVILAETKFGYETVLLSL